MPETTSEFQKDEIKEWTEPSLNIKDSREGVTVYLAEDKVTNWNDHYYHGGIKTYSRQEFLNNELLLDIILNIFGEKDFQEIINCIEKLIDID